MADGNITVKVSTKDAQKRLLYLHRENARLRRRIMADAVVSDEAAASVAKLAQSLAEAKAENAALKREAYTWWQLAASAPQDERKRCIALCKAQAERWSDDRARYAAIECAKAIEAQAPT